MDRSRAATLRAILDVALLSSHQRGETVAESLHRILDDVEATLSQFVACVRATVVGGMERQPHEACLRAVAMASVRSL